MDLWQCTRAAVGDPWSNPGNLGPTINTGAHENRPSLSRDGLILVFSSTQVEKWGSIFMSTRPARGKPWGKRLRLGPPVDSPKTDNSPCLSADGLTLIFRSDRDGGRGGADLYQATRKITAEAKSKSGTPKGDKPG